MRLTAVTVASGVAYFSPPACYNPSAVMSTLRTLEAIFDWTPFAVELGVALCFAWGMLAVPNYKAARIWFIIAGALPILKLLVWEALTDMSTTQRLLITAGLALLIVTGTGEIIHWIGGLEKKSVGEKRQSPPAKVDPPHVPTAEEIAEELAKRTPAPKAPELSGTIDDVVVSVSTPDDTQCLLSLRVHIKNLGMPTALEKYAFTVTRDGTTIEAKLVPPANVTLGDRNLPGLVIQMNADENLVNKTGRAPILTNIPVDAWFQAIIVGLTQKEILSKGTILSLSFDDVATGKRHRINRVSTGETRTPIDMRHLLPKEP